MKKRPIVLSFLLLVGLLLSSCSKSEDKTDKTPIEINGDLSYKAPTDYLGALTNRSASSLIAEAEAGGVCYFLVSSFSCSHCLSFEPVYAASLKKTNREISLFYRTESNAESFSSSVLTFQNKYGKDDSKGGVDGSTPRLYRLNKDGCYRYDFYSNNDTEAHFSSYLGTETYLSNITRYHSLDAYNAKHEETTLSFIYDPNDEESLSFYYASLYQTAVASSKKLDILDVGSLSEEDKKNLPMIGETYSPYLYLGAKGVDIKSGAEEATALISEYYQVNLS